MLHILDVFLSECYRKMSCGTSLLKNSNAARPEQTRLDQHSTAQWAVLLNEECTVVNSKVPSYYRRNIASGGFNLNASSTMLYCIDVLFIGKYRIRGVL